MPFSQEFTADCKSPEDEDWLLIKFTYCFSPWDSSSLPPAPQNIAEHLWTKVAQSTFISFLAGAVYQTVIPHLHLATHWTHWRSIMSLPLCALEKEMATHSSILAWKISWTEEAGELESTGSQRVEHEWSDLVRIVCTVSGTHTARGH